MIRSALPAVVGLALLACPALGPAAPLEIRIDFAANSVTGNPGGSWNTVTNPSGSIASLTDFVSGLPSGVSLTFADGILYGPGNADAGQWTAPTPVYRPWLDPTAVNDYHFLQSPDLTGQIVFAGSGIDPNKTYRIEILGNRAGTPGNRTGDYRVNGVFSDNLNSDDYDALVHGYNARHVMTWASVKPQGGQIVLDLSTTAASTALYLSAMRLTEAPAQTILFDIGDPARQTPGRWNNATYAQPGHVVLGAVDAAGLRLPIRMSVLEGFDPTPNAVGVVSDAAGFAATAQSDSFPVAAGSTGVVQIEGLVPGQSYEITLFGSRQTTGETRTSAYTIGGVTQNLVNTDNALHSVTFSGVTANARGQIQIDTSVAAGSWGYLGVVELKGTFQPGPMPVQSLLFDFGDGATQTAGRWNNVTTVGTGLKINGAVNSLGQATAVRLSITDDFDSVNASGELSNDAGFPTSAQRDSFVLRASGPVNTMGQIVLEGLDPGLWYDFTFFGSRAASGAPAGYLATEFRIGTQTALLENIGNTANTVSLLGIRPDASGDVLVDVRLPAGATFGYFGAMQVTAYVPEPASLVLLGLGASFGLVMLGQRRRLRRR